MLDFDQPDMRWERLSQRAQQCIDATLHRNIAFDHALELFEKGTAEDIETLMNLLSEWRYGQDCSLAEAVRIQARLRLEPAPELAHLAAEENERMDSGEEIRIDPTDNDPQHIEGHSVGLAGLDQIGRKRRELHVLEHVKQMHHKRLMMELAQELTSQTAAAERGRSS